MSGKSNREIFSEIYSQGIWGHSRDGGRFYSGSGSHDPVVTEPFLEAVTAFLKSLPLPPNVVDLGCGDFAVGSRLRPFCAGYVACDIVPALVEHHRSAFADFNVDFRLVDIASDPLPPGDVAIVRQVLQHMSNSEIAAALEKLKLQYRYLFITEHGPAQGDFEPNRDKETGAGIRTENHSAVVVTAPPFSLKVLDERCLCEVPEFSGSVRTVLYRLC